MASRSEATATVSPGSSTSNRIIDSRRLLGPFNFYIRKRLPRHERTMKKRGNACGQSLTCQGRGSKIPCSFDQRGDVDCRCCERDPSGVVFVRSHALRGQCSPRPSGGVGRVHRTHPHAELSISHVDLKHLRRCGAGKSKDYKLVPPMIHYVKRRLDCVL